MASTLPSFPRVVFTIIEPISIFAGAIGVFQDPAWFIQEQIPTSRELPITPNSLVLAWQIGNLYLLLGMIGLAVLFSTDELKVVRSYLFVLWIGDIGHIATTCYGLGKDMLLDVGQWNGMAWGNVAMTAFLFATRSAYFLGLFGSHRSPSAKLAAKQS